MQMCSRVEGDGLRLWHLVKGLSIVLKLVVVVGRDERQREESQNALCSQSLQSCFFSHVVVLIPVFITLELVELLCLPFQLLDQWCWR